MTKTIRHSHSKSGHTIEYIQITIGHSILRLPTFNQYFTTLQPNNYLDLSKKLVGSSLFVYLGKKNNIDIEFENIVGGGKYSCAYFVSNVLAYFNLIQHGSATVKSLRTQLESNKFRYHTHNHGDQIPEGAIVFWHIIDDDPTISPDHVGFSIGNNMAISNSSYTKKIVTHPLLGTKNNMKPIAYYTQDT